MIRARSEDFDAIALAYDVSGEFEPTLSIWHPTALRPSLQRFAAGERSRRRMLQSMRPRTVAPSILERC